MQEIEQILNFFLEYRVIAWIIFGLLAYTALRWQFCLLKEDFSNIQDHRYRGISGWQFMLPSRIKTGLFVCMIIGIGIIFEAVIAMQVGQRQQFPTSEVIANLLALLPFAVILSLKSFFGPIVTIGSLAIVVFYFINFQILLIPPLVESLFELASSLLPDWLSNMYLFFFTVYAIATSWKDANFG